ncbi:MAG: heme exporter protein CcmD [Gammaproteobacteria bacterium]|nr:MAG: heme exporter protein CcmD [Gammaproteobacteria bacterium]
MQPQFNSFAEFIAMGKHGVFVWTCWSIAFAVIAGLIFYSIHQRKNLLKQLAVKQAILNNRSNQSKIDDKNKS